MFPVVYISPVSTEIHTTLGKHETIHLHLKSSLRNSVQYLFLYGALYTMSQKASNIITLITGPFHSLTHLSSLGSIQPVPPNMWRTKLINHKNHLCPHSYPYPWVERSNYSKVSCSGTQVSWPGFKPTQCGFEFRSWHLSLCSTLTSTLSSGKWVKQKTELT